MQKRMHSREFKLDVVRLRKAATRERLGRRDGLQAGSARRVARRLSGPHPGWASRRTRSLVCSSGDIVLKTPVAGLPIWVVNPSRPLCSKMRLHLRTVQTEQPR